MEENVEKELVSMTVDELSDWLATKGIPSQFCSKFEGKYNAQIVLKFRCFSVGAGVVLNFCG